MEVNVMAKEYFKNRARYFVAEIFGTVDEDRLNAFVEMSEEMDLINVNDEDLRMNVGVAY